MNTDISQETGISRDVDQLRERFPRTPDLYREVCALLFFRYGITPTTNKLYQLVRKGSMSAPTQALAAFWEELRAKSRTKIEHPELPEALGDLAGELVSALWTRAQATAHDATLAYRQEADAAVQAVQSERLAVETDNATLKQSMDHLQGQLNRVNRQVDTLQAELETAAQERASLLGMLEQTRQENLALQRQHESARLEFSSELQKLHTAAQLVEERARSAEKRMLLDLDRERMLVARLQKEAEAQRMEATRMEATHRETIEAAHRALNESREQNARIEGQYVAAAESLKRAEDEIRALHAERDIWRTRAAENEEKARLRSSPRQRLRRGARKPLSSIEARFAATKAEQ
jgi:chromosome segregation ATPase